MIEMGERLFERIVQVVFCHCVDQSSTLSFNLPKHVHLDQNLTLSSNLPFLKQTCRRRRLMDAKIGAWNLDHLGQ